MPIMEIAIIPIGTPTTSISHYVVDAVKVLEDRGLKYNVDPMATVVEGELEELLDAAREMHEEVFSEGVDRVLMNIRIDDRRDVDNHSMERKVKSLKEKVRYKK